MRSVCAVLAILSALPLFAQVNETSQDIEELRGSIRRILHSEKVPGAGVAIVEKDRTVWAGGIGKAHVTRNIEVEARTHFRAGSITKSFVGLALARLMEEGQIDLHIPLRQVAPEMEFENPWEKTDPVRVVHLLEHTAGFDDMHFNEFYNLQDPPDISLTKSLRVNPRSRKVRWPPGSRWSYSNPGYGVAGYVIEKVSGKKFEDYIRETIFIPLGMTTSSLRLTETSRELLAQGYRHDWFEPVPYHHIYLRPAGSLNTSPQELARFVRALLNRGTIDGRQIISSRMVNRMERPETTMAARAGLKAGYGLGIFSTYDQGFKVYGHDGGIDGFISRYGYLPKYGVGYVVLLNSTNSAKALHKISDLLLRYVTRGITSRAEPAIRIKPKDLDSYAGYYRDEAPRNQLLAFSNFLFNGTTYSVKEERLWKNRLMKQPVGLVPTYRDFFRTEHQPESGIVFMEEAGEMYVSDGFDLHRKTGPWPHRIALLLLILSQLLMITSILFAPLWFLRRLLRRTKGSPDLEVRAVPFAGSVSFFAAIIMIATAQPYHLGSLNLYTGSFFVLMWLFVMLTAWGLLLSIRSFSRQMNHAVRIHSLLVSLANMTVALFSAYWGIIGLRFWAY